MSPAKSLTFSRGPKFCLDFYLKTGCGGQQLLRNGEGRIQQSKTNPGNPSRSGKKHPQIWVNMPATYPP